MTDFIKRDSGILIPAPDDQKPAPGSELTQADWDRFRHCNHESIDDNLPRRCGGFRFGRHVGKPLSQRLWEDLVHCFNARSLWIIAENEAVWTIARLGPGATIYIDAHGSDIVQDIDLTF